MNDVDDVDDVATATSCHACPASRRQIRLRHVTVRHRTTECPHPQIDHMWTFGGLIRNHMTFDVSTDTSQQHTDIEGRTCLVWPGIQLSESSFQDFDTESEPCKRRRAVVLQRAAFDLV